MQCDGAITPMEKISNFLTFHAGEGKLCDGTKAPDFMQALNELLGGAKQTHWIWYMFPTSEPSKSFGHKFALSETETALFLMTPSLCNNYVALMNVVAFQLAQGTDPLKLLMSRVDVVKTYESAKWMNQNCRDRHSDVRYVTQSVMNQLYKVANECVYQLFVLEQSALNKNRMLEQAMNKMRKKM